MFDLSGTVAIATGGSRGIGRAVAEGLAAAGADVVVASYINGPQVLVDGGPFRSL